MTVSYLEYPLDNGFIHNWLVVGPQPFPVADLDRFTGPDYKLQIARHYYDPAPGIAEAPAEATPITLGDVETKWEYVCCKDDHFVDLSLFHHVCHYLRAWAYAEIVSPAEQRVTCILTTNGPADLWLNGTHAHRQEHFYHQLPKRVAFEMVLQPGPNALLVRFEQVAARECPYAMALRVVGVASDSALSVRLPPAIAPVKRRQLLERTFYAAHLRQDVFRNDDEVSVHWPTGFRGSASLTVRVQTPGGDIYSEGNKLAKSGARADMGEACQFPDGAYDLFLMPRPEEYYVGGMRIDRKLRCWITRNRFSTAPYADLAQRAYEALVSAAQQDLNVFSEIAKIGLGVRDQVKPEVVLDTIGRINRRGDCSDFYLVGLLGLVHRYSTDPLFPQELRRPLEGCILGFKYWHDEPGSDAMCYTTENHSILFHTCEVLAGQLYPDRIFTNTGETGRQHRAKGEARAAAWLRDRGTHGFKEWDSNCYFEEDVLALSHLLSLADDDDLAALANVVLDKLFFTMAVNSYRGVFGSTHGRTYTPFVKSGYNEATSGISRLLWGMGVFNSHIMGTVSLALSDYQLPSIIADIAADQPAELWSRERNVGELQEWRNSGSLGPEVNKVTYRTPDYMLCSAQDWHPGEKGYQQHIWQATFGPDALVFVTHPTCASEEGSHRPNFWHGNDTLPRVAQWKDVLIAVHQLPEDDWMGFTHAFFPAYAFDEHEIAGNWAFARQGQGYIALAAARGLKWMTTGDNAYRELRSYGQQNVWLCHMGREALDGSFGSFKRKVRALPVAFDDLSVRFCSLRGDEIAFGWQGPLWLNGQEQSITGFKHIDNPYCVVDLPATQMDISFQDTAMRLRFDEA